MTNNQIDFTRYISSVLIVFIQLGIGMLQIGGVQSRRTRKMLMKSIFDLSICGLGWWFIGYGIAYGNDSDQFAGSTKVCLLVSCFSFLSFRSFALSQYSILQSSDGTWFLSWSLCSLSLSVVSSCVAERIRFGAYFTNATIYVLLIFPFIVHWAWGTGWASPFRSRVSEEVRSPCCSPVI